MTHKPITRRAFMRVGALSLAAGGALFLGAGPIARARPWQQAQSPAERAAALLAQMTLTEKIGQMTLIQNQALPDPADTARYQLGGVLSGGDGLPRPNTAASWAAMVAGYQSAALSTRLKIPILYGIDAVHGLGSVYGATVFPHNAGLGAAGDAGLVEQIGRATADEMAGLGLLWDYAPVLAVLRDPRWGRAYESYGEDTALVSALGGAFIRGLQARGVYATAKHYVGDGGTGWGTAVTGGYRIDQGETQGDEATLRAVHLPPYKAAIEAGAQTVMASFSSFQGVRMHANRHLLTEVLKGELGFAGFIVSDWGAFNMLPGSPYQQIVTAINAGIDMNMVPDDAANFIALLSKAVNAGDVPLARIDDAVLRILTVKYAMGLFEQPLGDPARKATIGSAEHRALARAAVAKSLVLLTNKGGVLPLAKGVRVLVAGRHANDIGLQCGGWTIGWQGSEGATTQGTTILEAIRANAQVTYQVSGVFSAEEVTAAGDAPIGIAVIGEQPYAEGKGDSDSLAINGRDLRIVRALRQRVKTLIVVIISGRPLILGEILDSADAIVAAWLPGTEGAGVADGLFGITPFTGKLSVSWPKSVDQLPFDLSKPLSGDAAPLFGFGHGLAGSHPA